MRRPKVDLSGCTVLALQAAPRIADRKTGEVATTADGVTKWSVDLFVTDPEAPSEAGSIKVTVPSASGIEVKPGQPVRLVNPRVMHWETGGRSGMAWSADGIEPVMQARRGGEGA